MPSDSPFVRAISNLRSLDRRYVPTAAERLDRLVARPSGALAVEPRARRILGALALVLIICAIALVVIGS